MEMPSIDNSLLESAEFANDDAPIMLPVNGTLTLAMPATDFTITGLQPADGPMKCAMAMSGLGITFYMTRNAAGLRQIAANFMRAADLLDNGGGKQ